MIAANLDALFPGTDVIDHGYFRVTRDADFTISDEADDLLQAVQDELRRRRFGEVVRLEVAAGMNPKLREQLVEALRLEDREVYDIDGPARPRRPRRDRRRPRPRRAALRRPGRRSPSRACRARTTSRSTCSPRSASATCSSTIPTTPSRTSVERFVDQAVADPDVLAIKQTVYRTSDDSPLVPSLIRASERGKQAVCMVELKARFDEEANIHWAKSLEEAGVHVVYGIPGLKTHVKAILVARREGDQVREYVHIGTGNYNPKTARLYTDLGLFTADPDIGADVAEMFNFLTGYGRPAEYRKVLVSPTTMRDQIIDEIERTVAAHEAGEEARIALKMNALVDARCIQALYEASQAGVRIDLNVRGICCLRPGVEGVSENITVRSIVGRFLEHSRDLRLPARRGDAGADGLGRPDAAQPRQPGRAGGAGRRRGAEGGADGRARALLRRQRQLLGARLRGSLDTAPPRRRSPQRPGGADGAALRPRRRAPRRTADCGDCGRHSPLRPTAPLGCRRSGALLAPPSRPDLLRPLHRGRSEQRSRSQAARRDDAHLARERGRSRARSSIAEQEGDRITHEIVKRLNSTFVTPIDREDIYALATQMDDIVDFTEEAADFLGLYKIEAPMEQAQALTKVLVASCEQLAMGLENLPSFKDLDKYWIEIHRLENDGDRISRDAVASLFSNGIDPMVVIRWKDMFAVLEEAIDATETAAQILEGIVIKNS